MIRYVAGFLFSEDRSNVALVLKQKPQWQAGLFNGIGGKIEPGETPPAAMHREFLEEAGVAVKWKFFTNIYGDDWTVSFFCAFSDEVYNVRTMESEEIHVVPVNQLPDNLIHNVKWLIPLILDDGMNTGPHMWAASAKYHH